MQDMKILNIQNPFVQLIGPFWGKREPNGRPVMALQVEKKHLDPLGVCHDGVLMTFAYAALSMEAIFAIGGKRKGVIRSMGDVFFKRSVKEGEWLIARTSHNPRTAVKDMRKFTHVGVYVQIESETGSICLITSGKFAFPFKDDESFNLDMIPT